MIVGRFAPSPTGRLHLGNLRTALAAHASAKSQGGEFIIRFEDLDRVTSSKEHARVQLADLMDIGVRSDSVPVFQSERFDLYDAAIKTLEDRGLTYECFCSRREIREATAAPHSVGMTYPGTCRSLTERDREARRRERDPALRLKGTGEVREFDDLLWGHQSGVVDDLVLRRNDGVPSYNVAVVVDDAAQGVTEVVRGIDLMPVSASHVALQELLGLPHVEYRHIPLVIGEDGERLAKRHGAVTLEDLSQDGMTGGRVRDMLWASLGQTDAEFSWERVPLEPWVFHS